MMKWMPALAGPSRRVRQNASSVLAQVAFKCFAIVAIVFAACFAAFALNPINNKVDAQCPVLMMNPGDSTNHSSARQVEAAAWRGEMPSVGYFIFALDCVYGETVMGHERYRIDIIMLSLAKTFPIQERGISCAPVVLPCEC